jgi:hypothetical protein
VHAQGVAHSPTCVPANMLPHITVDAPSASAFTMCPLLCTPPSAMIGTPAALASLQGRGGERRGRGKGDRVRERCRVEEGDRAGSHAIAEPVELDKRGAVRADTIYFMLR